MVGLVLGKSWQDDVRYTMGITPPATLAWCVTVLVVGTLVAGLLVAVGRLVRRAAT